jgi:hypothetical protein
MSSKRSAPKNLAVSPFSFCAIIQGCVKRSEVSFPTAKHASTRERSAAPLYRTRDRLTNPNAPSSTSCAASALTLSLFSVV